MLTVTLPVAPAIVDTIGHISVPGPATVKSAPHLGASGSSRRGHPGPSWENASMCPSPAADEPSAEPYRPYRTDAVLVEHDGPVTVVTINRPERRNAVDSLGADQL